MTVEPGRDIPWTRLTVLRFYRRFDHESFGPFNSVLALVDRLFAKLSHAHYHFLTSDRELCGYRFQDGDGRLVFEIPDAQGGVPLALAQGDPYGWEED